MMPKPTRPIPRWALWTNAIAAVAVISFTIALIFRTTRSLCMDQKVPRDIVTLAQAIDEFTGNHDGRAPSSLHDLIAPGIDGHTYLNITHLPLDPWGRPYIYEPSQPLNVRCLGRDGVVGGDGDDEDLDYLTIMSRLGSNPR